MATSTLKILREINDYTQEYIAEEVLSISKTTYARLEQDPSKINAVHAQKLAGLYKVSIANLLSENTLVITFQTKPISENNYVGGNIDYLNSQPISYNNHEGEIKALKEQNELLKKQNAELMELLKVLGNKLQATTSIL